MIRGFCFDLDETLVDAEDQHRIATRAMLEGLGYPRDALPDAFHDTTGARTLDLVERYRAELGARQSADEMIALRHGAFLAALDERPLEPLPGAREALRACRERGPVALVSSGHRDDILASLRSAGLLEELDAIVAGEDVEEPKPAPDAYRVAASRLGRAPREILAFEDSVRGVRSAIAAGCRVVAVPNPRSTRPDEVADAHAVLASLAEALPLDALLARLR